MPPYLGVAELLLARTQPAVDAGQALLEPRKACALLTLRGALRERPGGGTPELLDRAGAREARPCSAELLLVTQTFTEQPTAGERERRALVQQLRQRYTRSLHRLTTQLLELLQRLVAHAPAL